MRVPFSYVLRNLWARRVTTALTAGGLALVVFVFATVLMLNAGLKRTLVTTGEPDNIIAIRKGAETEIQSAIDRAQAVAMEMEAGVALGSDGRPLAVPESVVLIALDRRDGGGPANVVIRGTALRGVELRPQVRLTAGRLFRPGTSEVVVGSSLRARFRNTEPGAQLRFAQREWIVVGVFDAGGSGFDSEVWGDAQQLMQAFRRVSYTSVVARLGHPDGLAALRAGIEADPRLTVEVKPEQTFYSDQSRALSSFISVLGLVLSGIFSVGAMIGAMITLYASVANRVREIGTLRALGYRRRAILAAFLAEASLLGLIGGAAGLALASAMQFATFSTVNFQTFADLSFRFLLTPGIAVYSILFALAMGLAGGVLPALRAARLDIVDALRAT